MSDTNYLFKSWCIAFRLEWEKCNFSCSVSVYNKTQLAMKLDFQ